MDGSNPYAEFDAAVKTLPNPLQHRVSLHTSYKKSAGWVFCDAAGTVLREPPAPPPAKVRSQAPSPTASSLQHIERQLAVLMQVGPAAAAAIESIVERLARIERQVTGMQKKLDDGQRGIAFRGAWQEAVDYSDGSIVTFNQRAYVAVKAVRSGGAAPNRQGSGWLHMFDQSEVPR